MKTPLPDAQLIDITASWNPGPLHCLACGAEVFTLDGESTPCDHLLFAHMTEVGFTYVSPGLQAEVERAADQILRPTDDEFLELCPPATVVLRFDHNEVFWDGLSIVIGIEMPVDRRAPTD